MAIYTFAEISDQTGYSRDSISAFASPSKGILIKCGRGLVDMAVSSNAVWFEEKKREHEEGVKRQSPIEKQRTKSCKKPNPRGKTVKKTPKHDNESIKKKKQPVGVEMSEHSKQHNEYVRRKNELEIKNLEEKLRGQRLKNEQLEGDFISTERALDIISSVEAKRNPETIKAVRQAFEKFCIKEEIPASKVPVAVDLFIETYNKRMKDLSSKMVEKLTQKDD